MARRGLKNGGLRNGDARGGATSAPATRRPDTTRPPAVPRLPIATDGARADAPRRAFRSDGCVLPVVPTDDPRKRFAGRGRRREVGFADLA